MPTALTTTPTNDTKQRALVPLVTAHLVGHLGTKLEDYGKTVFGDATFDQAVTDRKAEMQGMATNGSHGSAGVCTSMMRTVVVLKGLGESDNAEELKQIAVEVFLRDTVEAELARVVAGW
ncbi:hypothetical protein LTR85_009682 [Meristemomyces frigidus]|nr:hypothetical protein LTR85_009682 [Meristemomyces frigidus]